MKQVSVFVGGPIQYAIDQRGIFHAPIRYAIELVISGLANLGCQILSAHQHEGFGEMDVSGKFQEVCARDFQWMQQCDIFVAVLPLDETGTVVHSAGTSVELGWASAIGKPIVLICDPAPVYSHLVIGLGAVSEVVKIDINRPDLARALCEVVANLVRYEHERSTDRVSYARCGNLE